MDVPIDNLTEDQQKTYEELHALAKMRAGKELGVRIYAALANSDLGVRSLASRAKIDLTRMEKGLAGKLVLTDDEVLRITDVVTIDARTPSRHQRAQARKARIAMKRRRNDRNVAYGFLDQHTGAAIDPKYREGFTESFADDERTESK